MAATSPRGAYPFGRLFLYFVFDLIVPTRARSDSPRMVGPVIGKNVRMPGSFGCDDDEEEEAEVDALVLGIHKLGVTESRD
jgi:hypothetical protein